MKRQIIIATMLLIIMALLMANAYVGLEYRVNLAEYLQLSSDYNDEEKAVIGRMSPLVYGGNISEPPLGMYNAENGQYTGMVVDYISALSIELGETIISRPMIWNEALEALAAGETDLCDMIPSQERLKSFAFSSPIYDLNGAVIVPETPGAVSRVHELRDRRVVVQKGDYAVEYLSELGIPIDLIQVDNMSQAMTLLKSGKADAVVGDEPVAYHYLSVLGMESGFRVLDAPLYRNKVSLGVAKDNQALLKVLDKAVFKLRQKGILAQIQKKWSRPTPEFYTDMSADKLKLYLIGVALVFSLAIYLIWIWSRSLKVLVAVRTRELEAMKHELQIVFDSMGSYLAVIGSDGTIININAAFLRRVGRQEDAVVNHPFGDIEMLQQFDESQDRIIQRWIESPETITFDEKYEFCQSDRILSGRIYPLEEDGVSSGQLLIMIADETVSRKQEMRLIHANKMETVGMLAAGVAHELRNPLGIIRNSGFILKTLAPEDTAYRNTAVTAIETSVERASRIIDNLLKHSRLTDDRKDRIRLRNFLEEILCLFKKQLDEQKINVSLVCAESAVLVTNGSSLWHGLLNIIQNALDAMPHGGELCVDVIQEPDQTIIRLKDSGPGISPEVQGNLFNPFFTTKAVGQGTGLGLYVAYSEIQKAGGTIMVETEPGKGACFSLQIPVGGTSENTYEATDH